MRMWACWGGWVLWVVIGLAFAGDARAQQIWSTPLGGSVAPSAPASDLSFNTASPTVFVTQNSTLYAFDGRSKGTGALRWTPLNFAPTTFSNFPSPVPLKNGTEALFFAGSDGALYGVDAGTHGKLAGWSNIKITLPNNPCSTPDALTATPAVQLYNFSNSTFQNAVHDDLVFVSTNYNCSATTNKVFAFYASTGNLAWTFNSGPSYAISSGAEGCAVDYDNNRLYCGFDQPANTSQPSLFGIASTSGTPVWATNAGSIHTRPTLRNGRVYVTTVNGYLRVRDSGTGAEVISMRVTTSGSLRNPFAEPRPNNAYSNYILVIDSNGSIYCYDDTNTAKPLVWSIGGYGATSTVATLPFQSRLYVGTSDGMIHELGYETGSPKQGYLAGSSTGSVYDPSVVQETGANSSDADHMYVPTQTSLAMFPVPWVPPSGCSTVTTTGKLPTTTTTCDGVVTLESGGGSMSQNTCTGDCSGKPGTVDTYACGTATCIVTGTQTDVCEYAVTCTETCCNNNADFTTATCTSLNTDVHNCGGCGVDCGTGNACFNGQCVMCGCTGSLGVNEVCNSDGTCSCTPTCPSNADVCIDSKTSPRPANGCNGVCPLNCTGSGYFCCDDGTATCGHVIPKSGGMTTCPDL